MVHPRGNVNYQVRSKARIPRRKPSRRELPGLNRFLHRLPMRSACAFRVDFFMAVFLTRSRGSWLAYVSPVAALVVWRGITPCVTNVWAITPFVPTWKLSIQVGRNIRCGRSVNTSDQCGPCIWPRKHSGRIYPFLFECGKLSAMHWERAGCQWAMHMQYL